MFTNVSILLTLFCLNFYAVTHPRGFKKNVRGKRNGARKKKKSIRVVRKMRNSKEERRDEEEEEDSIKKDMRKRRNSTIREERGRGITVLIYARPRGKAAPGCGPGGIALIPRAKGKMKALS